MLKFRKWHFEQKCVQWCKYQANWPHLQPDLHIQSAAARSGTTEGTAGSCLSHSRHWFRWLPATKCLHAEMRPAPRSPHWVYALRDGHYAGRTIQQRCIRKEERTQQQLSSAEDVHRPRTALFFFVCPALTCTPPLRVKAELENTNTGHFNRFEEPNCVLNAKVCTELEFKSTHQLPTAFYSTQYSRVHIEPVHLENRARFAKSTMGSLLPCRCTRIMRAPTEERRHCTSSRSASTRRPLRLSPE